MTLIDMIVAELRTAYPDLIAALVLGHAYRPHSYQAVILYLPFDEQITHDPVAKFPVAVIDLTGTMLTINQGDSSTNDRYTSCDIGHHHMVQPWKTKLDQLKFEILDPQTSPANIVSEFKPMYDAGVEMRDLIQADFGKEHGTLDMAHRFVLQIPDASGVVRDVAMHIGMFKFDTEQIEADRNELEPPAGV